MEYGAIDLHKKESQIRFLTEDGELVDCRVATTRDHLTGVFGGRPLMRILLESSTESEWVAQHLETFGHEVIVADPNYAPMYGHRTRRVKTDLVALTHLQWACPSISNRILKAHVDEEDDGALAETRKVG